MNFNLDCGESYKDELIEAATRVIKSNWYIFGKEVETFENKFASHLRSAHAIGTGCGTDAIRIILEALGIGPGDEVISPAFNVGYTALAIHQVGATPIFVDVDPYRLMLDPMKLHTAMSCRTRAVIPIHMFGNMANIRAIQAVCTASDVDLIEDACQAHGAIVPSTGKFAGTNGIAGAFSFYPTKNLGGFGDGGAIVTDSLTIDQFARKFRDGGRNHRYTHEYAGINSGLDEIQAAMLSVRLAHLTEANAKRQAAAEYYLKHLVPETRPVMDVEGRVYHLFVIRHPKRDELMAQLKKAGIPSLVHYPVPVHLQPCFSYLGLSAGMFPVAEQAANEVLSLPLFPDITRAEQDYVISVVNRFMKENE